MCGGSLVISPGDSGGTVVKVTIPDRSPASGEEAYEKTKYSQTV
jgi:hypothetical protein